jgi:hypothetical protein
MTRFPRSTPILLAALALGAVAGGPATARAQRDARTRIDTTFAFSKDGWVDLGLVSGEIVVTGWTRPEARVIARLERDGYLETTLSSDRIYVHTRSRSRRLGEARYEVMVPIGARVQASSTSGDIRIKATAAEVQVNAVSGDIEVLDARDRISITTVSGDVHAERLNGRTRIGTTSGDLQIDDITGDLSVHTVSSEITLRNVKSSHVSAGTVSGEITYTGTVEPTGSYEFNTHSGDVRIEIPSNSGATLELQTWSGSITSRFPMTLQPGERSRRGKLYEFTIGAGGARINAQTFSGDIRLERGGARSGREE